MSSFGKTLEAVFDFEEVENQLIMVQQEMEKKWTKHDAHNNNFIEFKQAINALKQDVRDLQTLQDTEYKQIQIQMDRFAQRLQTMSRERAETPNSAKRIKLDFNAYTDTIIGPDAEIQKKLNDVKAKLELASTAANNIQVTDVREAALKLIEGIKEEYEL